MRGALLAVDKSGVETEAAEWKHIHRGVRHAECNPLGSVPTDNAHCFDARACVHEGEGIRWDDFRKQIRVVHRRVAALLGESVFNDGMAKAMYVVEFDWEFVAVDEDPDDGNATPVYTTKKKPVYLHISMQSEGPWDQLMDCASEMKVATGMGVWDYK